MELGARCSARKPPIQTSYTVLYHSLLAPTILSDVDGQFRGPDEKVHRADGYDYYTTLSLWDTFRAENPLLTLIQPKRVIWFCPGAREK